MMVIATIYKIKNGWLVEVCLNQMTFKYAFRSYTDVLDFLASSEMTDIVNQ